MDDCTSPIHPSVDTEQWAVIPGFGSRYLVSSHGHIKSTPWFRNTGAGGYTQKSREFKPTPIAAGYPSVNLRTPDGRARRLYVHRLVAQAFVLGQTDERDEVNHIDGDKTNNRADNLQWCTRGENLAHAHKTGLKRVDGRPGEAHHNARLTEADVRLIRDLYATGEWRQVDLAAKFDTPQTNISRIVRRLAWRSVR